jgi:hypothetical protein
MSGLLFLSTQDFEIKPGTKGDILCHGIPGFSLILFYSTQCKFCQKLIPIFKRLPGTIGGCQFGMINVSTNKSCVQLSKGTLTEIKYVPYILLYINGQPYMRYSGGYSTNEIMQFVLEMSQRVKNKQKFQNEKAVKKDPRGGIPEYSIGQPLCGQDGVCYLEFDFAYKNAKNKRGKNTNGRLLPDAAGMGNRIAR